MKKDLVGANAIADYIGLSVTTLMQYINLYGFPAYQITKKAIWRSTTDDIDKWLESRKEKMKIEKEDIENDEIEKPEEIKKAARRRGRPPKKDY